MVRLGAAVKNGGLVRTTATAGRMLRLRLRLRLLSAAPAAESATGSGADETTTATDIAATAKTESALGGDMPARLRASHPSELPRDVFRDF